MNFEPLDNVFINGADWIRLNTSVLSEAIGPIYDSGRSLARVTMVTAALTTLDEYIKSVISGGSGGVITTKVLGENLVVSDGVNEWVFRRRDLSEALSLIDNAFFWKIRNFQLTEVVVYFDGLVDGRKVGVTSTESLTLADQLQNWRRLVRQGEDDLTVSDGLVSWRRLARTMTEVSSVIDTLVYSLVSAGHLYTKITTETIEISDALTRYLFKRSQADELLTVIEASVAGAQRPRSATEATTVADQTVRGTFRPRTIGETIVLSEQQIDWLRRVSALSESVTQADGYLNVRLLGRVLAELLGLPDSFSKILVQSVLYDVRIFLGFERAVRLGFEAPVWLGSESPIVLGAYA